MTTNARPYPDSFFGRLYPVRIPVQLERYRIALQAITGKTTALAEFHVDAAGWSPEIADELQDPHYLGQGVDHPFFVLLGPDQAQAALVQPNAGLAAWPYRTFLMRAQKVLAAMTIREPIWGEFVHGITRFSDPVQIVGVEALDLELHTPSDRVSKVRELVDMHARFLESDRLWHDDGFIAKMIEAARVVDGLFPPPGALVTRTYPVDTAFLPRFDGTYVLRTGEHGLAGRYVITAKPLDAKVGLTEAVVVPFRADYVLELLTDRKLVSTSVSSAEPGTLGRVEELQLWVALDWLVRREPERDLPQSPAEVRATLRRIDGAPAEFSELEDIAMRLKRSHEDVPLSRYSPLTRLRVAAPASDLPPRQAFVRHLQANLDPVLAPRVLEEAPDLFWARYRQLPAPLAAWMGTFLDESIDRRKVRR